MNTISLKHNIRQLFEHQRVAVIAKEINRQPYTNLVEFVSTSDLRIVVFPTKRDTQKYLNINENNRIALLIDDRKNTPSDLTNAITVTALGIAHEARDQNEEYRELLLKKHPDLSIFLADPSFTVIEVYVITYQIVQKFDQVQILHMRDNVE